jgi:Lrp/AsnC family transcriptional regulator of lysine biosynthesis
VVLDIVAGVIMDRIDTKIIETLKEDARTPYLRIAKELGVSEGTIRKRVAKLIKENIIKKFTISLHNSIGALVGIETNPHIETKKIVSNLQKVGLKEIFEVTGRFDVVCIIDSKNTESMNNSLEEIRVLNGVNYTETFTILKEN